MKIANPLPTSHIPRDWKSEVNGDSKETPSKSAIAKKTVARASRKGFNLVGLFERLFMDVVKFFYYIFYYAVQSIIIAIFKPVSCQFNIDSWRVYRTQSPLPIACAFQKPKKGVPWSHCCYRCRTYRDLDSRVGVHFQVLWRLHLIGIRQLSGTA